MRVLAIDTSSKSCSVALFDGARVIEARHEVIGRGHAERLVPMIAELPKKGRADAVHVALGPGSFTGVRIGLAAARALGLAWRARVRGFGSLHLLAVMAPQGHDEAVTICVDGGHGEWFVQDFAPDASATGEAASLTPTEAAQRGAQSLIIGNRAEDLAKLVGGSARAIDTLPDARFASQLPYSALTDNLVPVYGRAPDARKPA